MRQYFYKIVNHYKKSRSFNQLLSDIKQIETLAVLDKKKILPTELLKKIANLFSDLNVPFIIAGGFAYSAHVSPRATEDVDILAAVKDIATVKKLLEKSGFVHKDILEYKKPEREIIKYEYQGRELDIIDYKKYSDFVDFLFQNSIIKTISGVSYPYLGVEGLILTKLSSFRYKDKSDIIHLLTKNPDLSVIKQWCSYLHIMDRFSFFSEDHSNEI